MKKMKKIAALIVAANLVFSMTACSGGQGADDGKTFPDKDITFMVPYSAGGSSDQMVRLMTKYFNESSGVNLIINNVPGGAGNVGLTQYATEKPDGYTVASFNTTANLQPIYGNTEYDYLEIFTPIALCVSIPIAVTVPKDSPFETIEDLIAYGKENPGKLQYGHAGIGSITHVTGELFSQKAEIQMTQVPFGSGNDVLTALMGGHINVNIASLSEVLNHHREGSVKILAMCTDKKVDDIPVLKELGYDVDMKVTQGICTLKDVPEDKVKALDEIFGKVIENENYQKEIADLGMEVDYLNAADFKAYLENQRKVFEEIVTSSGIIEMVNQTQ